MQEYYGTKRLKATAMTRGAYNDYRGWIIPPDEDPEDAGYLVEYQDGGKLNDSRHAGYISWSPKDVFELAYQPIHALSFGHALKVLKSGGRVARAGWNGKSMWLGFIAADQWGLGSAAHYDYCAVGSGLLPWIGMKTADDKFVPWLASQTDILANDWSVLPDESRTAEVQIAPPEEETLNE